MGLMRRMLHREPPAEIACPRCGIPAPPSASECAACGWDLHELYTGTPGSFLPETNVEPSDRGNPASER
jgi:hypothetical protein